MNIKKIIREEMDDLQWMKDVKPAEHVTRNNVYVGMNVRLCPESKYIERNINNPIGVYGVITDVFIDRQSHHIYVDWVNGGTNAYDFDTDLIRVDNINESDDFDWAKDIKPANTPLKKDEVYIGMKVRIRPESRWYGRDDSNPTDVIGTVIELVYPYSLPIRVEWDEDNTNSYRCIDLTMA